MQAMVAHFCDKMVFSPLVPFIQMLVLINISLNLLLGLGSKLTISL
jgi:hypothetical protein